MILVPVLSIISLLVILSDLDWEWIKSTANNQTNFNHSIFGIVTISLSVVQVIGAFFRPINSHPQRFVFNYLHRTIGFITFVLSSKEFIFSMNKINF